MKQALEDMACMRDMVAHPDNLQFIDNAITALHSALAEPEQEPVVTKVSANGSFLHPAWDRLPVGASLYTHPAPQPVTLTDEEIYPLYSEPSSDKEMVEFARAVIEAYQRKQEGKA